jgi:hypothetical protein
MEINYKLKEPGICKTTLWCIKFEMSTDNGVGVQGGRNTFSFIEDIS